MKLRCMICEQEFIPKEEDAKRVVNTVDEHNLGTTTIIDMLTPLMGICNEETEEYHILDFDNEEREQLNRMGEEHKRAIENFNRIKESISSNSEEIKKLKSKLKDLISTNANQLEAIDCSEKTIENILSRCEQITFSKRIDHWKVEEEQQTETEKEPIIEIK